MGGMVKPSRAPRRLKSLGDLAVTAHMTAPTDRVVRACDSLLASLTSRLDSILARLDQCDLVDQIDESGLSDIGEVGNGCEV